jgi:hypothetical protein
MNALNGATVAADVTAPEAVELLTGAAGLRFRFTDVNPLTGLSYARCWWEDLPYLVGVFVREHLELTSREWDALVIRDAVLDLVGRGDYELPFTVGVPLVIPARVGPVPHGRCPDCWGTGLDIDFDASMTGVRDALYVCYCIEAWQ